VIKRFLTLFISFFLVLKLFSQSDAIDYHKKMQEIITPIEIQFSEFVQEIKNKLQLLPPDTFYITKQVYNECIKKRHLVIVTCSNAKNKITELGLYGEDSLYFNHMIAIIKMYENLAKIEILKVLACYSRIQPGCINLMMDISDKLQTLGFRNDDTQNKFAKKYEFILPEIRSKNK
ncbi:MAG: hypothetical protein SNJ71_02430, partial [Bacteroidales bacterium]